MEKLEDRTNAEYKQLEEGFIQSKQECRLLIKALKRELYLDRFLTYASGSVAAGTASMGIYELAIGNYMQATFLTFFTVLCGYNCHNMNNEGKEVKENLKQATVYFEKTVKALKTINEILDDSRRKLENGRKE